MRSCALWLGMLALMTSSADATDWMYERSWYSHLDSPGYVSGIAPRSRSAYRVPVISGQPSYAIRGGYRYNNIILFNGQSTDRTLIRENWADVDY